MSHYDEQFEKDILEASINIRNEHKDNDIEYILTDGDLTSYLDKVNKLKSDYILGDVSEEDLLKGIDEHKAHIDLVEGYPLQGIEDLLTTTGDKTDPWHPMYDGTPDVESDTKPLKDTEGKAHGARYCYLADIANCVLGSMDDSKGYRDTMNKIGDSLSTIVRAYDKGWKRDAMHYCSVLISDLHELDVSLYYELIKVRVNALNSGKYTADGYRDEIDVTLLMDAAARHFIKKLMIGDIDEESGCTHEAHIAANIIMIHTQLEVHHENNKDK